MSIHQKFFAFFVLHFCFAWRLFIFKSVIDCFVYGSPLINLPDNFTGAYFLALVFPVVFFFVLPRSPALRFGYKRFIVKLLRGDII